MRTLAELMALFDFTADDLAANRAGRLSDRQRECIETERLSASIEKAAAAVAVGVFLLAVLLFLALAYPLGSALGPWTLVVIVVWVVLAVGSANLAQRLTRSWLLRSALNRDHGLLRRLGRLDAAGDDQVRLGKVERFAGVLTHEDDGEHKQLMLDGEPFQTDVQADVDERLWKLTPGLRYAFYAVPGVLWVMSVEPLGSE
jgi:hypothetical protein